MAFTRSFEGFKPPRRFDSVPFVTVEIREAASESGTYSTIETVALSPVDTDPANPAARNFTTDEAVEAVGWYVIRWVDGGGAFSDSVPVRYGMVGADAFATVEDVATRLGRDLTSTEEGQVELLLGMATASIANAVGKNDEWAETLDPVPEILRGFCIELTCRAMANPQGLFSKSETIGSYSYTNSFNRDTPSGLSLSPLEVRVLRKAVGKLVYDVRTPTATEAFLEDLVDHEGS